MLRILFIILSVQMAFGAGCLEVQGRWVTAGYLAASIAEFRKLPPETHLLSAPWPGSMRILSNRDLIRMAQQHGVGPLEVAREFCIEQATEVMEQSRVATAVEQALATMRDKVPVEVSIVDFYPKKVPFGKLTLVQAGLMSACATGPCSVYRWRGSIQTADGQGIPFKVELRLDVMETVPVARQHFAFGEKIGPNGFLQTQRRVAWRPGHRNVAIDPTGKIARRAIRDGEIIELGNVRTSRDVESGETVELQVRSGDLVLVTQALAVTGGKKGDRVIVRNPSTKKNFAAVVTGPAQAETVAPVSQGDLD